MENQSEWRAMLALICYFVLVIGLLMASVMVAFVLFRMRIDYHDLPFPFAFISTPVNEAVILGVTLLFASHKGASLKELGLKKARLRILGIVSFGAVLLFLTGLGISVGEEIVFGPDPFGELFAELVTPRDSFQLIAMIVLSLVLVAPCEELAFRGFIQKGFENSFGKRGGLLVASVLWGLCCWFDSWLRLATNWRKYHRFGFDAWDKQHNILCNSVFSHRVKTLLVSARGDPYSESAKFRRARPCGNNCGNFGVRRLFGDYSL